MATHPRRRRSSTLIRFRSYEVDAPFVMKLVRHTLEPNSTSSEKDKKSAIISRTSPGAQEAMSPRDGIN
jgi:hypothetical protein